MILSATVVDLQDIYETTALKISAVLTCRLEFLLDKHNDLTRVLTQVATALVITIKWQLLLFVRQDSITLNLCMPRHGGKKNNTHTHTHTHKFARTSQQAQEQILFRSLGVASGCFCAGKVVSKLNQTLVVGASLLVMGVCLFATLSCGNLTTLSLTIIIHGIFSGLLTVGKTTLGTFFVIRKNGENNIYTTQNVDL